MAEPGSGTLYAVSLRDVADRLLLALIVSVGRMDRCLGEDR